MVLKDDIAAICNDDYDNGTVKGIDGLGGFNKIASEIMADLFFEKT